MFTGIVQALGQVQAVDAAARPTPAGGAAYRLAIDLGPLAEGLLLGASVAVNGACLTVAELQGTVAGFDVVPETWQRTTLRHVRRGDKVHLERALRAGDAFDGHFVQGHVDSVGTVDRVERRSGEWKLWVRCAEELLRHVVPKGSVTLDGTSLTVVDVEPTRFSVALIPTTLEHTNLGRKQAGDELNIETDLLVRAVLSRLDSLLPRRAGGLTWQTLQEAGLVP